MSKEGKSEHILMTKIYLDWNIITTLQQTERITNNEDKEIYETLKNLIIPIKDKILIPYSNGHLIDLLKSYKKGERLRVSESINFLANLTNEVCLTQYWGDEIAKWHNRNPAEYFESIVFDNKNEINLSIESILEPLKDFGMENIFDLFKDIPHNIDFELQQMQNTSFDIFFKKSKIDNSMYAVIEDILNLFNEIKNNPTVYNELSSMFKTAIPLKSNIHNEVNVIELLDQFLPKTDLKKSFTELYIDNNKRDDSKNKDYSKIIGTYMQLDFIGYGSDKLTDKNQYDNLFNDSLHCFYGAHCDFFITADKKTYKKSKAVYQSLGIATLVMKPKEFIDYIKAQL